MVHIVSHFASGDRGFPSPPTCTMRIVEKSIQIRPEANSIPQPIFRFRSIWRFQMSLMGRNMTIRSHVSILVNTRKKCQLTHQVCHRINTIGVIEIRSLSPKLPRRGTHVTKFKELLRVIACQSWAGDDTGHPCLHVVSHTAIFHAAASKTCRHLQLCRKSVSPTMSKGMRSASLQGVSCTGRAART